MAQISNLKYATFEVKGLEEYMENLLKAGADIDEAVGQACLAAAQPVYDDLVQGLKRHQETGASLAGVLDFKVQQDGNYIWVDVGISGENESWHFVFVEYGSPHNRPADPVVRTAFEANKTKVQSIIKQVLREAGVPVDG